MYYRVALVCIVMVAVASAQAPTQGTGTATVTTTVTAGSTTTASATVTTTTTRRPSFSLGIQNSIGRLTASIKAGIGLANTTAQLGGSLTKTAVSGFTGIGQQLANTVAGLKSAGLQGGINLAKGGIDIGTNLAGLIPGVGQIADLGGNMLKAGADVGNMVGQTGISAFQGIENGKLSLANSLVSTGANMATSGASLATGMAEQGVEMGGSMASGIAGTAGAVIDSVVDRINNATLGLSSMANNVATSMSVSADGTLTG